MQKVNLKDVYNIVNNNLDDVVKSKSFYQYDRILKRRLGLKWFDSNGGHQVLNGLIVPYVAPTRLLLGLCPNFCPKCGKIMTHFIDKHIWKYKGFCNSCLAKYLTLLKLNGSYLIYVNLQMMRNYLAYAKDARAEIQLHKFDVLVLRKTMDNLILTLKWSADLLIINGLKLKWLKLLDLWLANINKLIDLLQCKFDLINEKRTNND